MKIFVVLFIISSAFGDPISENLQPSCHENSKFVSCGTACPLTCENFRNPPTECNRMCLYGCECNEGYVKAENGSCILPETCPLPFLTNLIHEDCPVNSHFNSCGTDCPLTCDNYQNPPVICNFMCRIGCECDEGYVLTRDGSCIWPENCARQNCPEKSAFSYCGTSCPLTCENYLRPAEFCISMCKIGCQCQDGYVLAEDGRCVLPEDCPTRTADVCQQPRKAGPCKALMTRFYYSQQTKSCEQFYYGGCQGNDNNFQTFEECISTCSVCPEHSRYKSCGSACPITCNNYRHPPEFCVLSCNPGCHCEEGYVSTDDNHCVLPHECESRGSHLPFACQQDKEFGTCDQSFSRFFFNRTSAQCEEFIYRGCEGNDNNFQSSEDCEAVCQVEQNQSNII